MRESVRERGKLGEFVCSLRVCLCARTCGCVCMREAEVPGAQRGGGESATAGPLVVHLLPRGPGVHVSVGCARLKYLGQPHVRSLCPLEIDRKGDRPRSLITGF